MNKHAGPGYQLRKHPVSHFRLIRIVANLLLIVTMMIQPLVACASVSRCAVKSSCSFRSDTNITCSGCDSCQVNGLDDLCCCCNDSQSGASCCSLSTSSTDDSNVELHSACGCSQSLPPLGESSPKKPTNENRDQILPASEFANVAGADDRYPRDLIAVGQSATTLLHFSQRMLCIWRL